MRRGPASLVSVLHSRHQPGDQGTILQGSGVTLDELAGIAKQKLGSKVTVLRDLDPASFREHLNHVNDLSRRYVVNFTRGPLFGSGGGHHSPLAGYFADDDLVLVLDVNKKFGPWLVKSERLYEAMNSLDTGARKRRGMLLIERE